VVEKASSRAPASIAHTYENAGSAGILPILFTAFSWFVAAILAMEVGTNRKSR